MCDELPILKRCCCCLPLRTGLAVMGIAKTIIVASAVIFEMYDYCGGSLSYCYGYKSTVMHVQLGLYIFLAVIDFIFTVAMLTGIYLRHAKLLIISYYYTIVMTAICLLLSGIKFLFDMYIIVAMLGGGTYLRYFIAFEITASILILMFQFYMFLLIKGVIYEVTGVIDFKWSTRSTTDYECLLGTDSTDENIVTYSSLSKEV